MTRLAVVLLLAGVGVAGLEPQARAEGESEGEEESYPSWDWGGSVAVSGGYDDNISISNLVRFGEKQGSGTTLVKGKIGPSLDLDERWSLALVYAFEQSVYYSNHDLDGQTHKATLSGTLSLERVEATLGYAFVVDALIPKAVLYSLNHQPSLSAEVLLRKPIYVGVDYTFTYYDVRDAEYAYLKGQRHVIDLYPEVWIARKLTLYGGYRLELLRIGETVEEVETGFGGTMQVTAPQSYDGHFFFLSARWRPIRRLALTLDGRIGARRYTDPLVTTTGGAGPGPGGGSGTRSFARTDVVGTVEPGVAWTFGGGLSAEAWFYYERSSSSITTRRVLASSYDNIAAAGGARWEF